MKLIVQRQTDPYHNLATEEVLFQSVSEDTVYLWRNLPSVIVGRNQNTLTEVNLDFARSHDIQIARRLTGGGAVYQDLGNLNFSYIFVCQKNGMDFDEKCRDFVTQFIAYLRFYGIEPILSGRNDICIRDSAGNLRKIAGTAMTQKDTRGMFHLCLLFDADMSALERVLTPSSEKLESKGIASVRGRTANLKEAYPQFSSWSSDDFFDAAAAYFAQRLDLATLSDEYASSICNLLQSRYQNDDWTFGRNPLSRLSHSHRFPIGTVELFMEIRKGKITACHFEGDFLTAFDLQLAARALIDVAFDEVQISVALSRFAIEEILNITDRKEFIDFLLGRSISCIKSY